MVSSHQFGLPENHTPTGLDMNIGRRDITMPEIKVKTGILSLYVQSVADSGFGEKYTWIRGIVFDLLPQVPNIYACVLGLSRKREFPYMLKIVFVSQRPAEILHERASYAYSVAVGLTISFPLSGYPRCTRVR